jgi:hypothetical protein
MDNSFIKRGMSAWIKGWNQEHPNDTINLAQMDLTNDVWGENAKINFWRIHNHVNGLEYKPYPTQQLYRVLYPPQPA